MRMVVALGGNALLRRGQSLSADNQRANIKIAAQALAPLVTAHELVITHGNGPQVGLLALQTAAYKDVEPYPLDVLGAETGGMIGYMIEQELGNYLEHDQPIATLLTMIEVMADDPGFKNPSKPIGPVYDQAESQKLQAERGWQIRADGNGFRRVVASPLPKRILEVGVMRLLLNSGITIICTGGGGIPVVRTADGGLVGVEAVIDKDRASALLAQELNMDMLLLLTDVDAVMQGFDTPGAQAIRHAHPDALLDLSWAPGSMGPKIEAACDFVKTTGKTACIGGLSAVQKMLEGQQGTRISLKANGLEYY